MLNNHFVLNQFSKNCVGTTRAILGLSVFKETICLIPPIEEQEFIVSFLDSRTSQLNQTIKADKKLIELLKEKRTAIINHVVTKGLNPKAKMKDSGIEWIGEIPDGWEIKKIKHELSFFDYKRIPLSAEERGLMVERVYDYYGASGIIDKVEDYIFEGTFILLGEDGANLQFRSTPLAFLASGKFWVNNHAHIIKPIFGNIHYFVNLLETIDYSIFITGSAQPKLTADNLKNISIPVPPLGEQNQIAEYIISISSKIDQTIQKIEEQITLLEELKKSLIHNVVTGKVDVRGVVI
jgi:type I restriction enzyme S subunit